MVPFGDSWSKGGEMKTLTEEVDEILRGTTFGQDEASAYRLGAEFGYSIGFSERDELIVKAVNQSHLFDELVKKLEQVKKEWVSDVAFFQTEMSPSDTFIVKEVESLIAKAKASK